MNAERRPDEGAASQQAEQPSLSVEQPSVNQSGTPARPYASAARAYLESGWSPVPVLDGGKGQVVEGFTGYDGRRVESRDVDRLAKRHPNANIVVRLIGAIGLDVDAYDAKVGDATLRGLVAELGELPLTARVSARFGKGYDGESGIRLFRLPDSLHSLDSERVWRSGWANIEVIRFGHRQAVVWPSTHPETGATYQWMDERTGEIYAEVLPPPSELPELPEAWCQAVRERPGRSRRSNCAPSDSSEELSAEDSSTWWTPGDPCPAVLARLTLAEEGLSASRHDTCRDAVLALTRLGEQGHQGVQRAVSSLREAFLDSVKEDNSRGPREAQGEWARFIEGVDDEIARSGLTAPADRRCCGPSSVVAELPWPTPVPFESGCSVPFPTDALPLLMAAAVREVAEAVLVDPVIPATAFLGVAAGLVGAQTTALITPSWRPSCNLYLVVVVETGGGKTPGMKPALAPIVELEKELKAAADLERRRAEALLPGLKSQIKPATELEPDALDILLSEKAALESALSRSVRLMVDDTTPERLATLMADNEGRMIAWNDEGSMLKHALGLYSKTPNLDLFLKGWDGTRYVQDRKGGGGAPVTEIVLQHPTLTLVAAVQPTTIRAVGGSGNGELVERGLVGRMLISWPPSRTGTRLMSGRDERAYLHVQVWNDEVVRLARDGARELAFSPAAGRIFMAWHDEVEVLLPTGKTYADVRSFAVKTREGVARFAGLIARLEGSDQVLPHHVDRAIRLGDYYLAHAQTVAESWAGNEVAIARKILAKVNKYSFTVRDAQRWARGHKVDEIIDALEVLEAKGYVMAADREIGFVSSGHIGGKSPTVLLNSAVPLPSPGVPVVPVLSESGEVEERE